MNNTYEQKPGNAPAKSADITQPKDGKARDDVHQVTDKDVIKKAYSPLPKDDAKAPLQAAKGSDELMSQPPKQS